MAVTPTPPRGLKVDIIVAHVEDGSVHLHERYIVDTSEDSSASWSLRARPHGDGQVDVDVELRNARRRIA